MGELGLGHSNKEVQMQLIEGLKNKNIKFVYAANYHTFALSGMIRVVISNVISTWRCLCFWGK
jgi:DNA invertase Pin-like site-specific DNA recombinase